jgi:hypothetical protein
MKKKGMIAFDELVKYILIILGLALIFVVLFLERGKLAGVIESLKDFLRFR